MRDYTPSSASAIGGQMHYFMMLDARAQSAAIMRLHLSGVSDHGIASATKWSVEAVRRTLAEASMRT